MVDSQVSVSKLQDYWRYIEGLKDSVVIEGYIPTSKMPPWDEICSELPWQTYCIDGGPFRNKHHGYCGVYRLIGLVTDRPLKPATISRTCTDDATGTLYIGEAGWLNDRLNQLRRSLHSEDSHPASRMWKQSPVLRSKFPANKLGVSLFFTSVRMHKLVESDLIRAYLNAFGDTPPLNCSF